MSGRTSEHPLLIDRTIRGEQRENRTRVDDTVQHDRVLKLHDARPAAAIKRTDT